MENPSTEYYRLGFWVVLLLSAVLRLFNLSNLPPGLAQDEVLNADIVESIRAGNHAIFFREGFGHEPLFHYFSVPFQILLGDNFLSIRLPSVILGVLVVALTIVWARRWFGNWVGLVAGLGVATSWWAIVFSRVGIRPMMETLFLLLAVICWKNRPIFATLFLALTLYTYSAALVLFALPILLALYFFVTQKHKSAKESLFIFIGIGILFLPLYLTWRANPELLERAQQLSGPLTALREGNIQPLLDNIWLTLTAFTHNGSPRWTYGIPHKPLLNIVGAIFLALGLIHSILNFRQTKYGFLLIWFAVALLPSILTPDAPSMIRLIAAIPPTFALVGIGIQFTASLFETRGQRPKAKGSFILHPSSLILITLFGLANLYHASQVGFYSWADTAEAHDKYQMIWLEIGRYHITHAPDTIPVLIDASFAPIDADSLRRNLGYDPQARWAQTANGGALVVPDGASRLYIPEFAPLDVALLEYVDFLDQSQTQPAFTVHTLEPNPRETVATFNDILHFQAVERTQNGTLLSHWSVEKPDTTNIAIFLHVLDEQGNIIAQHDGFDAAMETLQAGDRIIQRHPLPTDINPNRIRIGLYNRGTGERWEHNLSAPTDFLLIDVQ